MIQKIMTFFLLAASLFATQAQNNLFLQPGVQWFSGSYGNNNPVFKKLTGTGVPGNSALQVTFLSYADGDAKWYALVPVTAGKSYTYQDLYRSNQSNQLAVVYYPSVGDAYFGQQDFVSLSPSDPNQYYSVTHTFTVPAGVNYVSVYHSLTGLGTLITANFSLTETAPAPTFSEGRMVLALDDCFAEHADAAQWAYLRGIPLSFFIVSTFVGQPDRMGMADVLRLPSQGHSVDAHSRTHPDLTTLDYYPMWTEIVWGQYEIYSMVRQSISTFGYPLGKYNDLTDQIVRQSFQAARTSDDGFNTPQTDPYHLKVKAIDNLPVPISLEIMLSWEDQAKRDKSFLIILVHRINYGGSEYAITPENFQALAHHAQDIGLRIMRMDDAIQDLHPQQ